MDTQSWIANGLGLISAMVGVWAARSHTKKGIMAGNALANVFLILQMTLLGAWVAAGVSVINTLRMVCAMKTRSTIVMVFFMLATALPWALSPTLVDAFPVLGSLIGTYAYLKPPTTHSKNRVAESRY